MKKFICFALLIVLAVTTFTAVACEQHTCQNKCPTCGKCLNEDCTESICVEKCPGHLPPHSCQSVCAECGKCTNASCTEAVCANKCPGHTPAHTCQNKCPTCGKCLNENCAESVCAEKCPGHAPAHSCQSVCDECGKCTNSACTEAVCANKCPGHTQGGTEKVTVYMVGDSTVCNYQNDTSLAFPRNGYGMWVGNYLNENATVVNLALSGRSSKSFLQEANYTTLKNSITKGDYLIIGFGHNDEKADDSARYTNPTGDVNDQTSFQYHLYTYYIKLALDKGAHPILCTPIVRRHTENNYAGSSGHVTNGGDYAQAIVNLGAQFDIPVIHLRDLTKDYYSKLSADQTAKLHATTGKVETNIDNTHLNSYGAAQVAYMFAKALSTSTSGLANYVDTAKLVAPVYEDVILKNEFDQPEPGDVTTYGKWEITSYGTYGTAKHQGLDLVYYSAGPLEGKVSSGVGYVKATDSAGNGSVKDGVISTEKGYVEFRPATNGILVVPIKNATSKAFWINQINDETDRIVSVGGFMAGAADQTGDFFTITTGSDRFTLTLTVKQGYTYWNYIDGCMLTALLELNKITGEQRYFDFVESFVDYYVFEDGTLRGYSKEKFNLDDINEGRVLFELYQKTGKVKYQKAIDLLKSQLDDQPRTNTGNFWHKLIYPNQIWLDGLYMAQVFSALWHANSDKDFSDIVMQISNVHKLMFNKDKGLYYHCLDCSKQAFWCDKQTGLSPNFWLRSIGWYLVAMADILQIVPADVAEQIAPIFNDSISGIAKHVNPTNNMLYQVVDCPERKGNYAETSGSCMVAYAMLKGARLGVIPQSYAKLGKSIFDGVCSTYLRCDDGQLSLGGICLVAGLGPENNRRRDGTFEYYISEPIVENDAKGVAPFVLCYTEVLRAGK